MREKTETVVIGAGLAGAATAWQLAARGHDVTVVERETPAHAGGSSHGSARIFRYAYPDPFYARLVSEARREWTDLEIEAETTLIHPTGALDFGERRNPKQLALVLESLRLEHELFGEAESRSRWPMFAWSGPALWHPGAGVIDAEAAVLAMLDLARSRGARVYTRWNAQRVISAPDGYLVESPGHRPLHAKYVVIAAGAWLPGLLVDLPLPAGFLARLPRFRVRREQALHFPYRDPETPYPTFIAKTAEISTYGLPGGRDADNRGLKVAEYNGGRLLRHVSEDNRRIDQYGKQRVVDYVRQHIPGVLPESYAETTCLFTNTPNEDFVLDTADGITILAACSGHGAKFAPLLGRWAADLVTGEAPVPSRFKPMVPGSRV